MLCIIGTADFVLLAFPGESFKLESPYGDELPNKVMKAMKVGRNCCDASVNHVQYA